MVSADDELGIALLISQHSFIVSQNYATYKSIAFIWHPIACHIDNAKLLLHWQYVPCLAIVKKK